MNNSDFCIVFLVIIFDWIQNTVYSFKDDITAEVTVLKDLKAKYKKSTGKEFVNPTVSNQSSAQGQSTNTSSIQPTAKLSTKADSINHTTEQQALFDNIVTQGNKIRILKSSGASKVN